MFSAYWVVFSYKSSMKSISNVYMLVMFVKKVYNCTFCRFVIALCNVCKSFIAHNLNRNFSLVQKENCVHITGSYLQRATRVDEHSVVERENPVGLSQSSIPPVPLKELLVLSGTQ